MDLRERYQAIAKKIPADRVTLLAVSKTHPAEAIEALYRLGHRDFGENYVQELVAKAEDLKARGITDIRWHFIGHLQTNKAKALAPYLFAIHSIDSEKLARELAKRHEAAGSAQPIRAFIEVNIDEEESKSGVAPSEAPALAETLSKLPQLDLRGLMCIPSSEGGQSGEAFRKLRELELRCRPWTKGELSMGMTQDFETAIREGSTHVRVGTAIFGSRPPKESPT